VELMGWRVLFDVVTLIAWGRCVVMVAARRNSRYRHGWWSKMAALLAVVTFNSYTYGLFFPVGAWLVWRRVLVADRDPFELPMADGRAIR
jgi:hypothetical protein